MKKNNKARSCQECKSHHFHIYSENGWYCGINKRWICSKSLDFVECKDYSHKRKGAK